MKRKTLLVATLLALGLFGYSEELPEELPKEYDDLDKPRGSDPKDKNKGTRMNQKKSVVMAILTLSMLSGLFLTACNFPVAKDEEDLPLEEWEVTRVEYNPTWRVPYVSVYVTGDLSYGYYNPDVEGWSFSSLISIPGLELSEDYKSTSIDFNVNGQTVAADEPLTAYFKHDVFIKREGEYWDQKDVARVRIKTESVPVTIIEIK